MTLTKWFSKSRDAARIGALQMMDNALQMYMVSHTTLPMPDDYVTIKYSGEVLTYQ